jgi:hypothetical protein
VPDVIENLIPELKAQFFERSFAEIHLLYGVGRFD